MSKQPQKFFQYFLTVLIFTTLFFSCKSKLEKYPGFTLQPSGLYYKLQSFGDSKRKPSVSDYLQLSIVYKTENDSVFLNNRNQNPTGFAILPAAIVVGSGSLGKGIMSMNEGDSTAFILNATNLFSTFLKAPFPVFLNINSIVKVDVKLNAILTKTNYEAELKKYSETISTWEVEEQRRIKKYITNNKLEALFQSDGMYYIPFVEGNGLQADSGKMVQIKYTGSFLSGQQFDATKSKSPFEFRIGDEFQVIWGLQQGIKLMKEGGKAKFIIPSYLAFGESGSSTGIVPPNTTVMYEVELLKVK